MSIDDLFAIARLHDDPDAAIMRAAAVAGAPYGMSAEHVLQHVLIGDQRHPDAPDDVCGAISPRNPLRWCVLAPQHDEDHNGYAPEDGCRTWTEHEEHAPECHLPDEAHGS